MKGTYTCPVANKNNVLCRDCWNCEPQEMQDGEAMACLCCGDDAERLKCVWPDGPARCAEMEQPKPCSCAGQVHPVMAGILRAFAPLAMGRDK